MLEVHEVHTYRGQSYVLQGVSMKVPDAACTTLLGRNGMGKTTLIRSLMGLSPPRSGSIKLDGKELVGLQPFEIAKLGLALVPQGRHIFRSLTVDENLTLAARGSNGQDSWNLEHVYEIFPQLKARRRNSGSQLSGGEQQMLAIARALMTNPRILLMDEPSEGLAPVIVERVSEVIKGLRGQKLSILLVEQNYRLGVEAADHVYILSKGVVVWKGKPEALEAAEKVRQTHLGV
ncbi:MAG TPA: ABC transporter ATP-binding protein [Candidatus Dormibacteraeota bacterium]|jgi:branched-chain amino acid transport system ATP-binding protein